MLAVQQAPAGGRARASPGLPGGLRGEAAAVQQPHLAEEDPVDEGHRGELVELEVHLKLKLLLLHHRDGQAAAAAASGLRGRAPPPQLGRASDPPSPMAGAASSAWGRGRGAPRAGGSRGRLSRQPGPERTGGCSADPGRPRGAVALQLARPPGEGVGALSVPPPPPV